MTLEELTKTLYEGQYLTSVKKYSIAQIHGLGIYAISKEEDPNKYIATKIRKQGYIYYNIEIIIKGRKK